MLGTYGGRDMKYFLVTLFLISTFQSALAVRFSSSIHTIDYGKKIEPNLIKFDNGRVGYVDSANVDLLRALSESRAANENIEIVLDNKYNVLSAQSLSPVEENNNHNGRNNFANYEPTIVKDYNAAARILKNMRRDYTNDGQCFNRAHIWAYEEFQRSGLNSMKLFLFFTNRYIRNYRFHWWFHVTPMVYVGNIQRTLDRRYTSAPNRTKPWSDIFIKSKRTCPTVKLFNSYANNQEKQDCYLLPASMYYVIPRDVEKRDLTGIEKEQFNQRDIEKAYKDAFKSHF
jgi:hypothetical protein